MIQKKKIPLSLRVTLPIVAALLVLGFSLLGSLFAGRTTHAATNSTINFQARLMTAPGAIAADGDYNVEFKIYNALSSSGSSQGSCSGDSACLWTETRTSGNRVRVANGYLTANLGSITAFPAINWDQELWISLNIGGKNVSAAWDGEMSPRLKLTAVPYAFRAGQLVTTNGSFSSTLGFVQPTANRTIQAPDESGTICLQNSASCGFVSGSAANYIQNQNSSDQTANFRISGTGRANTSLQAPLFDTATAVALNIGTTNATAINLNKDTTITGAITQSGGAISMTGNAASQISTSSGSLSLQSATSLNLTVSGAQSINMNTGSAGVIVKPTTDNSNAFQVQNAGGGYVFNVDTASNTIGLGTLLVTTPSLFDGNIDTYFSGDLGIGTSTATVLNLGHTGSMVTVQGNSSSTIKATSGSFTTTVGFTAPTANRTISIPNESGTICLQSSTACGFAPTSGSANYIQNSTSVQSANFYVQAATSGSVGGVIRANAAGAGNILNLQNGAGTNVAVFGSAGAVSLQNSTNSTAAFQVSASSGAGGNSILRVDSTNERVAIGVISDPIGAKLSIATSSTVGFRVYQGGSGDAIQAGNGTADFLTIGSTGNTLLKPTTNSTTAFRIQNANASATVIVADTTNNRIAIGQATASYTLDVAGDVNSTTAIRVGGTLVCDSTGCTAKSGSGFYIHNQTTAQSSNMYVQAATSGSVAGIFQANASGSGDILQLKNGAGTNVSTVSSTGAAAFRNSTNSTAAFQIQNAAGGQLVNVDTSSNIITLNGNNAAALNTWQSTSSLSAASSFGAMTVANGYAYIFGGYGSNYTTTVQYAKINPNGTVGTWSTTTALPEARGYVAAATANGYVYITGGTNGTSNVNTIYVGKVSADGTIPEWQESSVTLPASMNAHAITISGSYLYVLGGNTGSPVSTTYYSLINGDGSLNGFQSGTALPVALANAQAVVSNGYIYFVGGYNGTSAVSTVYYSPLNTTTGAIGSWTSTSAMLSGHNNYGLTISNGYMYAFKTGAASYAAINTNGTLGTWTADTNTIPVNYNGIMAATYNGYHYVFGGYTGSVGTSGVYYTSGSRTYIAGTLDLVGLTLQGSGNGDDSGNKGSAAGSLIAGNTNIVGTLQVQGQSNFAQNVSMLGSLTVGNDTDNDDALITVTSRRYAGIHLLSDTGNQSGEIGGPYILYSQDAWGTRSISGMVQVAGESPQGDTYTDTLANGFLLGIYNNFALQFGTNSSVKMTILGSGNVCIATTSCTKKLGVSGTIGASSTITANTTPDLAETIPAAADVEAADVVMADPNNTERVIKSDRAYNTAAVGVISDGTSSFMINSYGGSADAPLTGKPLVLVGRVPVKVTNEGGAIRPGDPLTSASKRGYAMKATRSGPTIGTALGSFNAAEGTVLVLVNLGYYDTDIQGGGSADFHNINATGTTSVERLVVSGNAYVQGSMEVGSLTTNGHIITKGTVPVVSLYAGSGTNATASIVGNDVAGRVSVAAGKGATGEYLLRITFNSAYEQVPRVLLTPVGKYSALVQPYVDQLNGGGFTLGVAGVPEQGREYQFNYQVMQ